jgi:hypothetical protein
MRLILRRTINKLPNGLIRLAAKIAKWCYKRWARPKAFICIGAGALTLGFGAFNYALGFFLASSIFIYEYSVFKTFGEGCLRELQRRK